MKKIWLLLVLCLSLAAVCTAAEKVVEGPATCVQCGMDRTQYAHSRMVVIYADGTRAGTCSLNCLVTEMKANRGKRVVSIRAADYHSKRLGNARIAAWVMGGDVPGVMTPVAKWAFARRADAAAFVKEHGGTMVTFDEALKAAEAESNQPAADHHHGQ